jgi:sugar-phosphatase
LATTHHRAELVADAVVTDLSAISVQVTAAGVEISTAD